MKRSIVPLGVAIVVLIGLVPAFADGPPFELVDGDRVVLIGGTMIERDQTFGYLETRLTRRYPDRSITFRNLGWSGDTVEGISQAGFGSPQDGFKHLVDHILALKPTVVILGYGANEAYEGKAGLPKFLQNLDKLLKAIEPTKARLVFLAPTRQENLGPPLPDPSRHNADLALYRDAIKAEAEKRGAAFVHLFKTLPDGALPELILGAKPIPRHALTGNGIHLTPDGYWHEAATIERDLLPSQFIIKTATNITVGGLAEVGLSGDIKMNLSELEARLTGVRFKLLDKFFPAPPPPNLALETTQIDREISFNALQPGRYALKIDGKPVAVADAAEWKKGVPIHKGPEFDQVEALRQAINAKNELYFYRWRPQNETYLFGFRKHEQGQNAREIPQFDPLVAAKEAEIAKLRVPVPHVYELIREGEVPR